MKSTNLVVYNHYWGTYSRLLGKQNGFSVELNLFPVNRDWSRVKPEMIRKHCTQRDPKDRVMHHKFVPEEIVKTIKANVGSDFAHKLMTFDYLGEMYNIFGVNNIEDLYKALAKVPNNGGMKWADIVNLPDKCFELNWLDGKKELVYGANIAKAFSKSYGGEAILALDYYQEVR